SGTSLRMKAPGRRGRGSAGGRIDRADAGFGPQSRKSWGRSDFCAQYRCQAERRQEGLRRSKPASRQDCENIAETLGGLPGVGRNLKNHGWQRTMTKVGKSDGEGTFRGTRDNDEVVPTPDLPAGARNGEV